MRAPAGDGTVGVFVHPFHKDRFENVYDHVMNDLFPHSRDKNDSLFPTDAVINVLRFVMVILEVSCLFDVILL